MILLSTDGFFDRNKLEEPTETCPRGVSPRDEVIQRDTFQILIRFWCTLLTASGGEKGAPKGAPRFCMCHHVLSHRLTRDGFLNLLSLLNEEQLFI